MHVKSCIDVTDVRTLAFSHQREDFTPISPFSTKRGAFTLVDISLLSVVGAST